MDGEESSQQDVDNICSYRGKQSEFKLKRINRVIFSNISKKHENFLRENRHKRNLLSIKVSERFNESSDQSSKYLTR